MIADLVRRRDEVLDDTEELSGKLTTAVGEHRPAEGADPFDASRRARSRRARGRRMLEVAEDEPFDAEDDGGADRGRGGARGGPEPEPEPEPEEKPKPKRRRSRKVRS